MFEESNHRTESEREFEEKGSRVSHDQSKTEDLRVSSRNRAHALVIGSGSESHAPLLPVQCNATSESEDKLGNLICSI